MLMIILIICFGLPLFAARCPTEDCYAYLETKDDAKNCHTFWGCRLAQEQGCPLESCRLNWVKDEYQLPKHKK